MLVHQSIRVTGSKWVMGPYSCTLCFSWSVETSAQLTFFIEYTLPYEHEQPPVVLLDGCHFSSQSPHNSRPCTPPLLSCTTSRLRGPRAPTLWRRVLRLAACLTARQSAFCALQRIRARTRRTAHPLPADVAVQGPDAAFLSRPTRERVSILKKKVICFTFYCSVYNC